MVIKVQGSAYALNSAANLLEVLYLSRLSALEPGDAEIGLLHGPHSRPCRNLLAFCVR